MTNNYFHLGIKDWLSLTKIERVIIPFASFLLGALLFDYISPLFLLPLFSISIIYASAAIFNDIYDYNIDIISNPKRPIPSKKLDFSSAYFLVLIILLIGLSISYITGLFFNKPYFFLIGLFEFILGIIYSIFTSKHFVTATATLGISHGFLPFIAGTYLLSDLSQENIWIGIIIFVNLFFTYNLKDFKDIEGDNKNRITLPLIVPIRKAKKIMLIFLTIPLLITLLSNYFLMLSKYQLLLSLVSSIGLCILGINLFKISNKEGYLKSLNIFRYLMVIYIFSFGF